MQIGVLDPGGNAMDIDCPLHHFGHLAYWDDKDRLRYCDNGELAAWPSERPCAKCGLLPTRWGHDPCIADLPGVRDACCGHGLGGYIAFEDGRMICFPAAEIEDDREAQRRIIAALRARARL
jgi:hypothetical protein